MAYTHTHTHTYSHIHTHRVNHANSWKLIKSHFYTIFTDIIFPMMCQSEEDDALWDSDPYEYIRMKFGEEGVNVLWDWRSSGILPTFGVGSS